MTLDEKRMNEIMMEETMGKKRRPPKLDKTADERSFRKGVRPQIRAIIRNGWMVSIPSLQPDLSEPDNL